MSSKADCSKFTIYKLIANYVEKPACYCDFKLNNSNQVDAGVPLTHFKISIRASVTKKEIITYAIKMKYLHGVLK
jgi:hypothetical protein